MQTAQLGIRWTIGDVSRRGFEALRLSVWCAWNVFGPEAAYVVCANSIPLGLAQRRAGTLPPGVRWRTIGRYDLPEFLRPHLDTALSEGTAWKFSPVRLFPDRYELALDNDCILWSAPSAIRTWLDGAHATHGVFAADVRACHGQYAGLCGPEPRNSGLRGLPPDFDYAQALRGMLDEHPIILRSEQDEQGLQAATLAQALPLLIVGVDDVSICSPFPPHAPDLGTCGSHFVGLNARALPWTLDGRGASEYTAEHWDRWREELCRRVGLTEPENAPWSEPASASPWDLSRASLR